LGTTAGLHPLGWGPALFAPYRASEEHPVLEAVFTSLLVLVCVGVLAFAGLTVKKLYQGQR
jgi:hypothetical protein